MFYSLVNIDFKIVNNYFWVCVRRGIYYKYGESGYFYEMYF